MSKKALYEGKSKEEIRKLEAYLDLMPAHIREMAYKDPASLKTALEVEVKNREKNFPSINFIPNIAQERALRCLAAPHEKYGNYPRLVMFCAANGLGKTCCIASILLPGACLGPDFVNKEYCNWQFFRDCEKIRRKRKLLIRLVCDAKDMKEDGGSLYQQIKKWIPTAKFKDKTGDFFQTVVIGDCNIDVKTHSMDATSHAGPDYDLVIFNEPAPKDIYAENVSRTRMGGLNGEGGYVFLFLTPLGKATYLRQEIVNPQRPDGELYFTEGNIWENCKDIPGTRGVLSRQSIEFQISTWKGLGEDEYQARAFGKFTSFSGVIFPIYSSNQHFIDPFEIPSNFNMYHLIDPHMVKPPFSMWIAKSPLNQSFVVAEYPLQQWDQIKTTSLTIKQFCTDFDLIEKKRHPTFTYMPKNARYRREGDPNLMNVRFPNSGMTLKQEYAYWGYSFGTSANDDITLGHDRIRENLYYDVQRPISSTNMPRLFVFKTCKNTHNAFLDYMSDAETGKIDPRWKCIIDLLRYYFDIQEPWSNVSASDAIRSYDEYDEIDSGRDPFQGKPGNYEEVLSENGDRW